MRIECNYPEILAAIIRCLNLPISQKVEYGIIYSDHILFMVDQWDNSDIYCTQHNIWCSVEIRWYGAILIISHSHDIGHYEIDLKTAQTHRVCGMNEQGKIKYGRYYEPSMD